MSHRYTAGIIGDTAVVIDRKESRYSVSGKGISNLRQVTKTAEKLNSVEDCDDNRYTRVWFDLPFAGMAEEVTFDVSRLRMKIKEPEPDTIDTDTCNKVADVPGKETESGVHHDPKKIKVGDRVKITGAFGLPYTFTVGRIDSSGNLYDNSGVKMISGRTVKATGWKWEITPATPDREWETNRATPSSLALSVEAGATLADVAHNNGSVCKSMKNIGHNAWSGWDQNDRVRWWYPDNIASATHPVYGPIKRKGYYEDGTPRFVKSND